MSFFIECAIRVTLILAVAFAISLALRKQSAAVRHLVWMVAFAVALVTPFLAKWGPQTVEPVTLPIAIEVNAVATGKAKPPARQSRSFPFEETALAIWAAGVLVQAIRAGRGVILANSLKRSAWPIDPPIDIPASCNGCRKLYAPCTGLIRWRGSPAHKCYVKASAPAMTPSSARVLAVLILLAICWRSRNPTA